jgi:hypothetical protein
MIDTLFCEIVTVTDVCASALANDSSCSFFSIVLHACSVFHASFVIAVKPVRHVSCSGF